MRTRIAEPVRTKGGGTLGLSHRAICETLSLLIDLGQKATALSRETSTARSGPLCVSDTSTAMAYLPVGSALRTACTKLIEGGKVTSSRREAPTVNSARAIRLDPATYQPMTLKQASPTAMATTKTWVIPVGRRTT